MRNMLCAVTVLSVSSARADIIIVPDDYPSIQAAILAALEGDTVLVASGKWKEAIFLNGHDITLQSIAGPEATIIHGGGTQTLLVTLGESPTIRGFTLIGATYGFNSVGGSSPTFENCIMTGNGSGGRVSGITSSATLRDCRLVGNADAGLEVGPSGSPTATLFDCYLADNTNFAVHVRSQVSTLFATRCEFRGGKATVYSQGSVTLTDCLVAGSEVIPGFQGNGIELYGQVASSLVVNGSTISDNDGSGINGNGNFSTVSIANSIIWGNGTSLSSVRVGQSVTYSNIEDGYPGSDFSILADPLFIDPVNGDFRLSPGSPCIDAGENASASELDLDGNPRRLDDPFTDDCPQPGADCGVVPVVDMGAFEFVLCDASDLDGDGLVGINDFLLLLAAWGTPDADGTGDGDTGIADFLLLLSQWGPCS